MLFLGVFLPESARTAAKSRTNLSTNSGKATKRLGRLAPNLAHMCKFILEWIYAKQIAPRETRGHLGVLGGQQFKSMGSCPIGTNFGSRLRIHLGMDKSPLNTPGVIWGGGGRVSQIQNSWEAVKRLDRLAPNLVHICRSIWEWIYAKKLPLGGVLGGGGVRSQTFKSLGKLSNGWTDWHQHWFTSVDSSGNGRSLNPSRASLP